MQLQTPCRKGFLSDREKRDLGEELECRSGLGMVRIKKRIIGKEKAEREEESEKQ
jgi:hypothetical protein